jgi:hypothetical protein
MLAMFQPANKRYVAVRALFEFLTGDKPTNLMSNTCK